MLRFTSVVLHLMVRYMLRSILRPMFRYTSDGYTVNLIPSMLAGAVGLIGENLLSKIFCFD